MSVMSHRERGARNFMKRYGRERLKRLIDLLHEEASGQAIAEELGVSRERVRQWKNVFGKRISYFEVYPEVQTVLEEA
jgi:DNA-directed RNA polymerase sigma subunit (sigma70/sigma32)